MFIYYRRGGPKCGGSTKIIDGREGVYEKNAPHKGGGSMKIILMKPEGGLEKLINCRRGTT